MAGSLYVVGTPIGNLEDMSVRAVRTLQEADFIAAEDTRVTLKLLNHFAIKKPMLSYHEHNARQKGGEILTRILQRGKLRHRHRRGHALHLRPGRGPGAAVRRERGGHQGHPRPQRRHLRAGRLGAWIPPASVFEGFL